MPAAYSPAATVMWTNGIGNRLWSNAGNWSPPVVPTNFDDVIFPNPVPGPPLSNNVLLSSGELAKSVTFNTSSYSLLSNASNASLLVASGVISAVSGQSAYIEVSLTGAGVQLIAGGSGSGTVILGTTNTYTGATTVHSGTLQLGNGGPFGSVPGNVQVENLSTLSFNHSTITAFGGVVSGAGGLNKLGTNLLILTTNNTYTGGTTISGGTLQIGNFGTVGSIVGNVTDNATLAFNRSDNITFAGNISGSGALTKMGTNTLTLTGNNTHAGVTTINSGGTLSIGNGGTSGAIAGNIANDGTLVFNRSDDLTYAGAISLGGQVVKLGTNTLTLTGNSIGSSETNVTGTLRLGNGGTSGSISSNVTGTGTVVINRSDDFTFLGAISGGVQVIKLGSNTVTLISDNSGNGLTTVSAGTLQLGAAGPSGLPGGDILDSGSVVFNHSSPKSYAGNISGSGTFTKLGGNTLTLTGNSTYTGGTTVAGGTLQIGAGTTGSIVGNVLDNATIDFGRSDDVTFGGTVSGSGVLNKSGAGMLVLSGDHTYTGQTFVQAGTLQLGNGGTTGSINGSTFITDNGTIVFDRSDDLTFAGFISGSGNVAKLGANTMTVINPLFYSGATTIAAGTLVLGVGTPAGTVSNNIVDNGLLVINHSGTELMDNDISGTGGLTKLNGNTLVLSGINTYTGLTTIAAGTLRVGAGGNTGSIVGDVANSATLAFDRLNDLTYAGSISGSGAFSKRNNNTLTLAGSNTYSGATSISAGTLVLTKPFTTGSSVLITDGTTLRLAPSLATPNNVVLRAPTLNLFTSGTLDLGDNKLIVPNGTVGGPLGGGAYNGLTGLIQQGRNGGNWSGTGILTSSASGNFTTLGIASGAQVKGIAATATAVWGGQTVTGSDTLVMFTYGGDANLDGKINVDDYGRIDSSIPLGLTGWYNGDFNYDAKINVDDYGIIDSNIGIQGAPFSSGLAAASRPLSAVPEPMSLAGILAACGVANLRRRLRRRPDFR